MLRNCSLHQLKPEYLLCSAPLSLISCVLINKKVLSPRGKKVVRRKHVGLIFQKRLHPLYVVILSSNLQLIGNQQTQLTARNQLQISQSVLEHSCQLLLDLWSSLVDIFYASVNNIEQLFELVLAFLEIGVHLVDHGGSLVEKIRYFL